MNQDIKSKAEVIRDDVYRPLHLPRSKTPTGEDYSERKLTRAQKKLLYPTPEDLVRYKEFLRQPSSGLIRLLPRGKYENFIVGSGDHTRTRQDNYLPIPGGGAFYSFTQRSHVLGQRSDILLKHGLLRSGFVGEALGLMVMLGDIPLDSVAVNSPGVDYLATFVPPTSLKDADDQHKRNSEGFNAGRYLYMSALPVKPDTTYALRSVAYEIDDILIVFRVIRQDDDGSVVLLWKRIQKFQVRKLKE